MATEFTFETVDGPGTVRGQSSLALDKNGNPRIAYANSAGVVMLARRDADTWTSEEVESGAIVSPRDEDRVCLAIDSQGNPHIAYVENSSDHLIYGVNRDNDWTLTPVPTHFHDPKAVMHISFQLHPGRVVPELRDTPHFSYKDLGNPNLGYTRMVAGKFVSAVIDDREAENTAADDTTAFDDGLHTSSAFELLSEELRIAYFDQDNRSGSLIQRLSLARIRDVEAKIVSRETAIVSILDSDRILGICASLASNTSGFTYIAYVDLDNRALKAWVQQFDLPEPSKETVDTVISRTVPSAAHNRGAFRIAYAADNQLKLASRDRLGDWTTEVVDPAGGEMPSLAYDNFGNAHIAYTLGSTLKYAKRRE